MITLFGIIKSLGNDLIKSRQYEGSYVCYQKDTCFTRTNWCLYCQFQTWARGINTDYLAIKKGLIYISCVFDQINQATNTRKFKPIARVMVIIVKTLPTEFCSPFKLTLIIYLNKGQVRWRKKVENKLFVLGNKSSINERYIVDIM